VTQVDQGFGAQPVPIDGRSIINDVSPVQPFGIRRDTFWPRSVVAWIVLSTVMILASVQLVTPTRRWRPGFLRRPFRKVAT
jgi:hypothetical protein